MRLLTFFKTWLKSSRNRAFLLGGVLGGGLCVVGALFAAQMVEWTGDAAFCGRCHEMKIFVDTWEEGHHGTAHEGIEVATCADCHLPHTNVVHYLAVKGYTGNKDILFHVLGKFPNWEKNLERREAYTYESACRKCHVKLEAPGISLKGFQAHRDYLNGATEKSCISCHSDGGHGDLLDALRTRKNAKVN